VDPVTKFIGVSTEPRRIVGIVPDIDDQHVVPAPTMTMYQPMEQEMTLARSLAHAKIDPYARPQQARAVHRSGARPDDH
jgi:putative ABC transport system permease protein